VRLEESYADQLSKPGDLGLQSERLSVPEQVGLLDLSRCDEVLDAREASADLEGARRPFGDLEVDIDGLRRGALLRREIAASEVTESDVASFALFEVVFTEELPFFDLHLPPQDLVTRLGIAFDLDALDVDLGPATNGDDDIDLALDWVELG